MTLALDRAGLREKTGTTVAFDGTPFWITWDGSVVVDLSFHPPLDAVAQTGGDVEWLDVGELPAGQRRLAKRLQRYFRGLAEDFGDVELELDWCSRFQRDVIDACRGIPYGQVCTYAELAVQAGSPRASRAVGNVMRTNRFPIVVPCHRVVRTGGGLGGFSAPSGVDLKRRLLALEGAEPR